MIAYLQGVTASYLGVSETIIQFVLYEYLREVMLKQMGDPSLNDKAGLSQSKLTFALYMLCGGTSKLFATTVAYPHGGLRWGWGVTVEEGVTVR